MGLPDTANLPEHGLTLPPGEPNGPRQRIRNIAFWLLIAVGLGAFLASNWKSHQPFNLVQSTAFFLDPTHEMTFEQARQQTFTPYVGNLSEGFKRDVVWIRITLDPALAPATAQTSQEPVVVRVRPPYLDHLELFDPLQTDRESRKSGDRHRWKDGEFKSLNHGFVVPLGDTPRDIWLRVFNDSTLLVGVDAMPLSLMNAQETLQSYQNSIDLVFLFFLLVWGLVLYWMTPDRIVMGYIAIQFTTLFYAAAYFGLFRIQLGDWISPDLADKLFATLIILMPSSYLLFFRQLFSEYGFKPWMTQWVMPIQLYPVVGITLVAVGYKWIGVQLAIALSLVAFAWLLVLALKLLIKPPPRITTELVISPRWAAGAYLVFMLAMVVVAVPTKGIFQASDISLYRNGFHTVLSSTLLGTILFIRARRYEARRLAAIVASTEEAKYERRRREEQAQFFAMLTHEIRTPLAVMSYASRTAMSADDLSSHVDRCVTEIDEIIERCEQADQLEQGAHVLAPQTVKLGELIASVLSRFQDNDRVRVTGLADLTIDTDRTLLGVVLSNLIDNALKYSEHNSPVELTVALANQADRVGVQITVTNPVGEFDTPDPARVYDKYYRSATAHARTGSGLGLYLVKAFTEKLGGKINYRNEPPLVTFELWIPT